MIWHAQRHDIVSLLWYSLVLSFNSQLNAAVFHGSGSTPRSTQHEAPKKSVDQQCWDIQRWQHNMFESVCKYFLCFNGLKCLKSLIAFFWRHEIVETGRVMCMNLSSWEWNGTGINLTLICLIYKSDMVSEFFIPCWIPGWNPSWLKCFCFRWFFHRKLDQQAKKRLDQSAPTDGCCWFFGFSTSMQSWHAWRFCSSSSVFTHEVFRHSK